MLSHSKQRILEFVRTCKVEQTAVTEDTELLRSGIIDSLDVLRLILHIEESFSIALDQDDLTEANLSSAASIAQMIERKCHGRLQPPR